MTTTTTGEATKDPRPHCYYCNLPMSKVFYPQSSPKRGRSYYWCHECQTRETAGDEWDRVPTR